MSSKEDKENKAQGRCETTMTERFEYPGCKCGASLRMGRNRHNVPHPRHIAVMWWE